MANSQQNPFLDLTTQIDIEGLVGSLKDQAAQTAVNAAFQKLFREGATAGSKGAVDEFIKSLQDLTAKSPKELFKDTVGNIGEARKGLDQLIAAAKDLKLVDPGNEFAKSLLEKITSGINSSIRKINELNSTKVNIQVDPASFKSFDDLARRLELALADVARLNEELAQGVAQGNLKVSPEVQNSVENTANQVANLGKQVEFLSKEVLAFVSVLQVKIGETSGATSFVGKILGIDSETILKQLGDFTKQLEDLGRRSSQSFAKGFAEGGQDSARDAVRSIVSDLATELTKIKDLSTIKFEGLGQFDKITTAADALLDVLDKVVGKELQVEDLFNKVITGKGRTKFRPVAPIELPEGTIGLDKSLSPEKASQVVKSLNETFFQRIVSYAVESSRQFRNAFTEANNALEIDFRATFQTITEILEKFVATAETLVPKIFKLGQGEGDSDAKLISERLKSIQEEITKTEEAQAAARTKAQKKEFDQKIESLKLYQKGLESAQAKGGFTVGGTAAEEHLDKEAKQLQEIVNLIVEIGKQSKIAGVLILLKGPNEHFAKEIELLKGINSQIVQVGNAAQVASLEVAKLGDNVKLEQFKKNLGEIQAALELAREQLSSSKGTAEIGDLLVIDQRKVKARLAEVEAAIREFTARAQADLKAPGTTQIRELEDRLRRLRDDAREVSSLLREAKTPDDFRVLGDAKQEIKEEILEVRDALIKARREFQDNLSGDFKAEIASLKKARADLLAEKNKLSREFDASYSKELNSLIASLEKKIQALEKEEAKLKGIILGSEQPQTGGAQEDQEDQRIKAAKATADAIKEIEKALKGASTAGSTLADILTKIDRPTRTGTLTSTGLAGGVLGDPTATPAITEALNKTKASQAELARLTQEGAAQRLKVFAQEREKVLDLINRATSERVALTQRAEAQVEALIEKSGATQEKREELRLAKESVFAAERARIKADAEAAIQKLDLKTTRAGDLVIEAQEKRIKRLVTNIEKALKGASTAGLAGGVLGDPTATPAITEALNKTKASQAELARLTQEGAAQRLKVFAQEREDVLDLINRATSERVALTQKAEAQVEALIEKSGATQEKREELRLAKESAFAAERARIKADAEAAIQKLDLKTTQAGDLVIEAQEKRIKRLVTNIEKALKGASTAGLAGGVLGDPTATPAITEALNKTKASQAELARLTQEGAAQRLKVFAQEREKVLDLINRATSERVALTQKAEAQVEALIEKSGATQEKREELRLAKESVFAAERARIKADAEAAIQKLDLKTTRAGDLVIEAQEKRIKAAKATADAIKEIEKALKGASTAGLAGGVLGDPTATPKITEALNKTRASQKELLALTQEGAAERLKVFEQERQAVLDLIGKTTAQRVALTTEAEAQVEAAIAASGAAQEKQEELRARKALEFSNERERIAADEAAAIEKLNLKAIRAADIVAEAQAKRIKTIVLNYENAKKSLETLSSAFQGFRPFSTQGFGVGGGGGTGPIDFGNIGQLAGKLPELFKSATGEINPYIAVIAKATEVTFQFIKAAKALVDNALEFAKNQRQLAQAIDLSRENIAAFTLGFQRAGQPVFSLDIALSSLQQKIEAAFAGDEKASKFLDALGTSATNAAGGMQSLDVALSQIARDAATTGETTEKAAARVAVFGIFGQRAVGQTIRTFEALRKEALETGLVLSEQAEGALFDYYTSITRIETIVQGLINTFAAGIAPAFTEFNKRIGDLIKQLDLKDPDAIKQFESALKNILGILADGLGTLAELKNILDLISVPLNAILTLFTGEASGATEVKLKSFIGLISRLVEVLSDLAELASNFRFGPIGALFNLVNGSVGAATGKTLIEQIFGKPEDARVAASSITNIGEAADAAGKKVENLGTLLAKLKREANAKDRASEEAIAREQERREEAVAKVRRDREEGKTGPLAAAQEIARIENESAARIKQIRTEQYELAKQQVKEITGLELDTVKQRLEQEKAITAEKLEAARLEALARVRAAEDKVRTLVGARDAAQAKLGSDLASFPQDSVLAGKNRAAAEKAEAAAQGALAELAIEQDKYKKLTALQAKDAEDFKKHVQEKVDAAEAGGKREAQAATEQTKTAEKNRTEEFKAAQEERDNLLKQGTASLQEAVNKEIGIIQERAERGIITEKAAAAQKLKLEREVLEAKLKIQEGFARGANQPVKGQDTTSLAGIYDKEIQFYEKRVAFQKEAIALDKKRAEGEKLLGEEAYQRAQEDEQFLENLKRKRDEVVQARIEGLRKERDAAKPESIERARLDAEIAANQAILDGRIQTQEQITKNEQEMSQTRTELAKNEASGKKTAIEEEIANRSRLIQIAQNELNLLEARANAQQEAIKRQSGLTQEQIDAGAADYELTQARINASIRLLQAKLAILDTEIANARATNANAPEIISLEAQRLDIATQLNEVLRTRFELLDKAAAKEREAFSKGAGAAGGGTRSTDDPLFGAPQSYEEGQAAILAAIKAQREAGAEAFNGLGTLYTYYANLVGEATKAGADQITGLIDKLQADIRGLTNPGGAQIAGLLNYFTNQAKDALQAAFRRRDELLSAEAEKAAKEAADKALAERKRVEDGVKAIAQRQADAEKAAAERLEEQLKDLRKQREDAIREDAERRIELQEDLAKRQADLEKRFIEEDIARARQAARDKFDLELDFIRSLAQARFDAATQAFNAAKDFAKKDYDLRQSLAKNDTSIQDAEKAYRDQLGKVQETKTKLDQAKTAADRERLQAELRADTEALNANLKAIADLQKEREALRKDREAAAKVRDLERQRQQQLADLFRRAALGELDKEELDLLVRQLNQRFDLERDYINDRNEAAKTGDAEYLQQIEDAYSQQKEAQAELHRQELAADKKFREEKKRRELEDEGLRQADRAKQRQDLIDGYNDQLKDLDKALEKRLNAIKENEKKVKDEYKSTLDKIKEDSAKALAELGIAYDKFFEGLVEKVKNVGTEVGKVLKSIGDLANGLPDTKGSGDSSSGGSGGPATTSSEGNPNGPSVGSGYQNPKDAPKGGPSSVGPANPSTGGASGPSSSSGYQNPKDAPKGGPSTVGPTTPGGSGGGSSTTSSAGLGLRNKGQGGGNDLSGTADNGNRITFSGLSSEVLTNDIINKATGLKRGERATPKSAIEVLDYALNPYHYDKDGKKVYEPAYISQADYARAVKRIKDFYQPANIEALYKRRVITASYAVGMVEDAFAAGFYGKQKADPEYTRLRKAAFFEGNGDNTYAKYGDIIKALEDGKISPAQAWDQAARRSRLIGGDLDARRVAVYLKEFWGYDANPGDAFRPQGYDPAKDTGPALTTEGGGTPGLGSDTPNTSTGDLNNIISGGTLLAGASSIAGKGDLSSVGEIQGATPTYDTASVVDIGPVNLTGAPGKVKKGNEVKQKKYNPTNAPIGPPVNQPTKFSKGNPRSGPGPDVSPRRGFKKQIATEKPIKPGSPVIEAYNEIEGVKKLKAEFRRIFDYASAGTHTRQEIQSEINISAGLVTYLGNKGLFKEPGGIKYETYRRAIADLLALAQLTPEGFATFTSSPFFEGKYVPPPGDTNPALSYSPASPPTILPSSPTLSSIGGVTDLSTLQAVTTPSLPSYNIQAGSGGSQYSAGNPSASDITGAFRDAAPIVRSAAGAVTNAIRTMLKDAITLAAREMSNQIVSDISVGRHAR